MQRTYLRHYFKEVKTTLFSYFQTGCYCCIFVTAALSAKLRKERLGCVSYISHALLTHEITKQS